MKPERIIFKYNKQHSGMVEPGELEPHPHPPPSNFKQKIRKIKISPDRVYKLAVCQLLVSPPPIQNHTATFHLLYQNYSSRVLRSWDLINSNKLLELQFLTCTFYRHSKTHLEDCCMLHHLNKAGQSSNQC